MPPTIIPPLTEQTTIVWMEPVSYAIKLTLFAVPSNLQILKSIASCVPLWNRNPFSWYTAIPLWEEFVRRLHATSAGPVIYTAHGFHFFKGAKPINWLCYYPMELLSPLHRSAESVSIMKIMKELKFLQRPIYRLHPSCRYRSLPRIPI